MNNQLLNKILHQGLTLLLIAFIPTVILLTSNFENSKKFSFEMGVSQIEMPDYSEAETNTFANNNTENIANYFCLPTSDFLITSYGFINTTSYYHENSFAISIWEDIFIPPPNA